LQKDTPMSQSTTSAPPTSTGANGVAKLLRKYEGGPVKFNGTADALVERHLRFDHVLNVAAAGPRQRFEAFARCVRDILSQRPCPVS
jgi:starch phosphorylase